MTIACIDLYNALLDNVLLMIDRKSISLSEGEVIRSELREAMWHSGGRDETRKALCALGFHYDLPIPPEADITPDDLPFDFPDSDETPTLTKRAPWFIPYSSAPDQCPMCGGSVTDGIVRCVCKVKAF